MSDAEFEILKTEGKKGKHYNPKSWFAIEFADLDLEDDESFINFINKWEPQELNMSDPDDWYIIKMNDLISSQLEILDVQDPNVRLLLREKLVPFQKEIRTFIEDFNHVGEVNKNQEGALKYYDIISNDNLKRLNFLLGKIHFQVKRQTLPGYTIAQVIVPHLEDFECCLYYNFMEYIKAHSSVLTCANCGKYISNPSRHQLANAKRDEPSLHKNCKNEYKLMKDRKRKRGGE